MNVEDLTEVEREALVAALCVLANADGRVGHKERAEIEALADELGAPDLTDKLAEVSTRIRTIEDLTPIIAHVIRDDARELIRTILFDLANADGVRSAKENGVLDLITREWARR